MLNDVTLLIPAVHLEQSWFLSEQAGTDVGTTAAARSYVEQILPGTASHHAHPHRR